MGKLVMLIGKRQPGQEMVYYSKGNNYSNINAVENLIRYITRARKNETRADDLLGYGAVGAVNYLSPEEIISQFLAVQDVYRIDYRRGRRMYHEVYNLLDDEARSLNFDPNELCQVGFECSQIYFHMGYQTAFAVHYEPDKRYHIHFAINSISYLNGNKFHSNNVDTDCREHVFNEILRKNILRVRGITCPIINLDEVPMFVKQG